MSAGQTSTYEQRVADKVLPLSVAGVLSEALTEWRFSGETIDHGEPSATCGLCDHEELRYHFRISNDYTGRRLWVGSKCILQFEVAVYEGSRRLSFSEARRKLAILTEKMRLDSCLKALRRLAAAEDNDILRSALEFYEKHKYLTPRFAFVVFWKLQQHRVDHNPSFFKVNLRRQKYRDDLRDMPSGRVHMFWSALTASQREIAERLGHPPPR
jgi:hypothetical protein